jgi:membrane fusion protein (multidrug efflux system)
MLKTIFGSVVLIAIVVGSGALIARQKILMMTTPPPPFQEQPEIVNFATTHLVSIRHRTTAVGTALAPRSIQLRTEVVGTVSEIGITSGEKVHTGKLLLKLDTSVEDAQLDSAIAALDIAESTAERTKKAADAKAISVSELEQANALTKQATAEVKRLKAIIRKKTLLAPFDARAGLFDVHLGQYLPEGTQITMLQGIDDYMHVDFMMPQQVADEVAVGHPVHILIESQRLDATIVAIDTQSDRVTRNLLARAKLNSPPPSLQPNDSVRVELEYGRPADAVTIPASGLRRSPNGAFVYMVVPDPNDSKKLITKMKMVQPGQMIGQMVAIMQGLDADVTIVSEGSFKLNEKQWVVSSENDALQPGSSSANLNTNSSSDLAR